MLPKKFSTFAALVAILVFLSACDGGPPAPPPEPDTDRPSVEQPTASKRPTSTPTQPPPPTASHTPTPSRTPTPSPTATRTRTPTTVPTSTLTFTPTKPPLPSLPDFDDVLTFGTGGAEDGFCLHWEDFGTTACYLPDNPQWTVTSNKAEIWITNPMVNDKVTLASQTAPINVEGRTFPANSPVFILVYVEDSDPASGSKGYRFVDGRVAVADSSGRVFESLSLRWQGGKKYVLIGSTSREGEIKLRSSWSESNQIEADPWDVFQISIGVSSSCPGAPPQRMAVGGGGYVCTKEDNVRMRSSPARSARTIVSLSVGSQFTVIDGPSCADNWSWWNIRLNDGTRGWIAEGGDEIDLYFICPLP